MEYDPNNAAHRRRYAEQKRPWLRRVGGVSRADWEAIAAILLENESDVQLTDSLENTLRMIQRDARIRDGRNITIDHIAVAMNLVQQGRVFESRRTTP